MSTKKKIIVCCDGTWMNADNGTQDHANSVWTPRSPILQQPSNVTRIARCVSHSDKRGNEQITYYQSGLGTHDLLDQLAGGIAGMGLSEHIREAYQFIAANHNADAQDEIYLIGFSRGSFTARSIAAFINDCGLLTPAGMVHFYPVFEDWVNQMETDYKPHFKDVPFAAPRPSLLTDSQGYTRRLVELGYATSNIKIKAVACFDTVGSLGLPRLGALSFDVPLLGVDYSFVDTTVPPAVEHAIHALALDERRAPFKPTMWELPNPKAGQTLTQCWFAGSHADVGGSYADTRQADIALAWMVGQLSPFLDFDMNVLRAQYHQKSSSASDVRDWSCGRLHDSYNAHLEVYFLCGKQDRAPMDYCALDHATGEPALPKRRLKNTNETVHSSVRLRMGIPGHDLADEGKYHPRALEQWTCRGVQPQAEAGGSRARVDVKEIRDGQKGVFWEYHGRDGARKNMPEAPLGDVEYELLRSVVPSIEGRFLSVEPM